MRQIDVARAKRNRERLRFGRPAHRCVEHDAGQPRSREMPSKAARILGRLVTVAGAVERDVGASVGKKREGGAQAMRFRLVGKSERLAQARRQRRATAAGQRREPPLRLNQRPRRGQKQRGVTTAKRDQRDRSRRA